MLLLLLLLELPRLHGSSSSCCLVCCETTRREKNGTFISQSFLPPLLAIVAFKRWRRTTTAIPLPTKDEEGHPFCFRKFFVLFWLLGLFLGTITRRNDPFPSGRSQGGSSLFVSAAVEAEPADDSSSSSTSSAFLLLCLTDGSIYSVEAWTGAYQSSIATDPLLQTHRAAHSTDIVLPGLDGRLYWRPPPHRKDDEGGTVVPQPWQELPLTVTALLENPVRSCDPSRSEEDGDDDTNSNNAMMECGILTAQAVTSLLALTETGELLWRTGQDESSRGLANNNNNDNNILLLQRKDYWVQHVLASTGQQSWNVSLGTYQALDFGLPDDDDDDIVRDKAAAADPSIRWLDDDDIPDEPQQSSSHHHNSCFRPWSFRTRVAP